MDALIDLLARFGIFFVGLIARLLVFVAIVAAISVPILVVFGGVEALARLRRRALGIRRVGTLAWRPGVYYAPGHTWVAAEGAGGLRIGLDDLARRLLPGRPDVALPRVGAHVRRGEPVTTIGADGERATIVSPVDGTVTAVNHAVRRDPSLLHRDPYVRGWLLRVQPSDFSWETLPREERARRWLVDEGVRLERMLEQELGYAAADGGELICPVHALVDRGRWRRLADAFLRG